MADLPPPPEPQLQRFDCPKSGCKSKIEINDDICRFCSSHCTCCCSSSNRILEGLGMVQSRFVMKVTGSNGVTTCIVSFLRKNGIFTLHGVRKASQTVKLRNTIKKYTTSQAPCTPTEILFRLLAQTLMLVALIVQMLMITVWITTHSRRARTWTSHLIFETSWLQNESILCLGMIVRSMRTGPRC
jgi:hypothetical protein